MKKLSLVLACAFMTTLWVTGCFDKVDTSGPVDPTGIWTLEITEDSNTCPEFYDYKKKKKTGPNYTRFELSQDGSELTVFTCKGETEDTCESTGDTYDFDGNTFEFSETDIVPLEITGLDCSDEIIDSVKVTFTSATRCTGNLTQDFAIIGEDAKDCIDVYDKKVGEGFGDCTIEASIEGTIVSPE